METSEKNTGVLLDYLLRIQDSYTSNAKTYLRFLSERGFTIVGGLKPYFEHLGTIGYRASTVRLKRAAAIDRVRRAMRHPESGVTMGQRGRIEWHISELSRDYKAPKLQFSGIGQEKLLSAEDYRKVLEGCHSARQAAFLRFLYSTGCRVSEMTGIKLSSCTNMSGVVYITVLGKGRKERVVRIQAAMFEDIRATFNGTTWLFETSGGKPYVRGYVSGELRKLTKRILGRPLSAHKLRHSFATRMIVEKNDPAAVTKYMGNSSIGLTLQYYSHNELTDKNLEVDSGEKE